MAQAKYVFKFENTAVASSNYQIVDVDVNPAGGTVRQNHAQILAYFSTVGFTTMGGVTRIAEVLYRPLGAAGAVALVFPTAEFAAVIAAATADGIGPAGMPTGYGSQISAAGNLAPLGTSISVSELTATVGRTGRGRHFLPFVGVNTMTGGGGLVAAQIDRIREAYLYFLQGIVSSTLAPATSPVLNLSPLVTNAAGTPIHLITTVKPQPIFSNLASRRR